MIDIYIEEANDRKVKNSLNLTWELEEVAWNEMIFQLNFDEPVNISPLDI